MDPAQQRRTVAFAFFATAAVCGLAGMVWGAAMGVAQDFEFAPAHAHLNLLGWVSLALMGAFYAGPGSAAPRAIAWTNWLLSTAGALAMPGAMAVLISGDRRAEPLIAAGAIAAVSGLAAFLASVLLSWRLTARSY
jgi:hypothetical protein